LSEAGLAPILADVAETLRRGVVIVMAISQGGIKEEGQFSCY